MKGSDTLYNIEDNSNNTNSRY